MFLQVSGTTQFFLRCCYNSACMSEPNEPVNETPAVEPAAAPARTGMRVGAWLNLPLVLGGLALVLVVLVWLFSYRQSENLHQELAKRLSTFDNRSMESRTLAGQAQESSRDLQVKIGVLEQKLAESQSHQLALESMYQELARGRDETVLAEIEQLLLSASNELQLAANVKAALIALQAAEARLTRLDRPQLFPLRKAIGKDIERLRAAPYVDLTGLSLKLDGLIDQAERLPLQPGKPIAEQTAQQKIPPQTWWHGFAREVWDDFVRLVRIQDLGKAELPLLAPEQAYFARENLKLRLLSARLAMLAHDDKTFKNDLRIAHAWLQQYYDTNDRTVKSALQTLQQISNSQVQVDVPDIADSLHAVRNLKLTPERGNR